mgnify:CR=1 FL=1
MAGKNGQKSKLYYEGVIMEPGQFLWVEKYRPRTVEECVLPEDVKKQFSTFIQKGEVPNLLLVAQQVQVKLPWLVLYVNP